MSNFHSKVFALLTSFALMTDAASASINTPKEAINLNNSGVNKLNKGNIDEAIELLLKAIKLDPNYIMPRCNLSIALEIKAKALIEKGRWSEALELIEKAKFYFPEGQTANTEASIFSRLGYRLYSVHDLELYELE